ncbi:MAG TPA: stalk domain-containing protein [Candidatus Deferrimicrobium sp.]|nr:stalk domain-containing protein [Candidatus Deferrimicrobium sp.]
MKQLRSQKWITCLSVMLIMALCLALGLSGVLAGAPAAQAAETQTWTQLPLSGSMVSSLAINPKTPTTLYAGTNGAGVFGSVNSGSSWTAMNTGLTNKDVLDIVINPSTPAILYSGTLGGVFRSKDSGTTWTAVNTGLTDRGVNSLVINPKSPSILYAGTGSGVFRSKDSGTTWTAVNTGLTNKAVSSLAINPRSQSILYVGTGSGVFHSKNSGTTWTAMNTGLTNAGVKCLAVDPATSSTLYAGTWGGVFRSKDSSTTWTAMNTGLTNGTVTALAINPKSPTILYAGTGNGVFRYDTITSYALTTTVVQSAAGSISRSPDASSYAPGTTATLTASPASGYVFTGWSGALTGKKNPATVTMDADKNVTALFALKVTRIIQLTIGSRTMYVDGSPVILEAAPIILNSRTLLPIRAVVEAIGGTIVWDASAQKVTIVQNDKTLVLWIDRNVATLNGQSVNIDSDPKVVPIIMSGRTLLPLRFVAETLAMDVQWNATTRTVTITYTT